MAIISIIVFIVLSVVFGFESILEGGLVEIVIGLFFSSLGIMATIQVFFGENDSKIISFLRVLTSNIFFITLANIVGAFIIYGLLSILFIISSINFIVENIDYLTGAGLIIFNILWLKHNIKIKERERINKN